MIEINKIYNESCLDTMSRMENNFVDLTVTSPPYDNLRTYNNNIDKTWGEHIWKPIIKELYRVTKEGGVVVWVVGDATINGSETGTSFRQALYAMECGFNLHDTMIYQKNSSAFPARRTSKRYTQIFEYMFVFLKGKIRNNICLLCDKPNKWAGHVNWGNNTQYDKNGKLKHIDNIKPVPDFSLRNNIWNYVVGFNDKTGHPAVFPEQLAKDHIISWSNEGDLVYDPFIGSGTTAKMAYLLNRNFIGSEISEEYCKIANERIKKEQQQLSIF